MRIPGFAQLRMAWRILRSLNRIADALERAYPPAKKKNSTTAEVVEFNEAEEAKLPFDERAGNVPWDQDET
jgi:hypothetical protein